MISKVPDLRIALVGDIHGFWTRVDTEYFSESNYDALVFTGDLGNALPGNTHRIAREINKVKKLKFLIPGNHDTTSLFQLAGEILNLHSFFGFLSLPGHLWRWKKMLRILDDVRICQYNSFQEIPGLTVLGARPLSMGGRLNFSPFLLKKFGIGSMQESADRLRNLAQTLDWKNKDLIVLAHNGPSGLGDKASDIWGCDFRKEEGDFGDEDLGEFLRNSIEEGKIPKVVIAGHMHHFSRRMKRTRTWKLKKDGVLYINAARVPRIISDRSGVVWHHHIKLTRTDGNWNADTVYLKNGREESFPLPKFLEREKSRIEEI